MTEHDRPTQSGTISKAQQHKPSAHYEITSPGLRFTADDLRTEAAKKNRKHSTSFVFVWSFIREEKKQPCVVTTTWRIQIGTIVKDSQNRPSILYCLFLGIMVFLFIFAGLARLWYVALIFPIKEEGSLILNKNVFKIGTHGWHCIDCSWIAFLGYFEKIAHMSVVWACISLWLCIFVTL